jgi:hypothetical protein
MGAARTVQKERENITRIVQKIEGKSPPRDAPSFPPLFGAELKAIKWHFPNENHGSPGFIITEKNWFFTLTSGCGRHFHKNVCRNINCERKGWRGQNKS